jgi:hypothetical protein
VNAEKSEGPRRVSAGSRRSRLNIVPNAFGQAAGLTLTFAATIRAAGRGRAVEITAFERRHMVALRAGLDQEYEAHDGLEQGTKKRPISAPNVESGLRLDLFGNSRFISEGFAYRGLRREKR